MPPAPLHGRVLRAGQVAVDGRWQAVHERDSAVSAREVRDTAGPDPANRVRVVRSDEDPGIRRGGATGCTAVGVMCRTVTGRCTRIGGAPGRSMRQRLVVDCRRGIRWSRKHGDTELSACSHEVAWWADWRRLGGRRPPGRLQPACGAVGQWGRRDVLPDERRYAGRRGCSGSRHRAGLGLRPDGWGSR